MNQSSNSFKNNFFTIDLLKSIAVQVIIVHHLSNYGLISDAARELFPALLNWIGTNGRYAVQIFLVIGGFLAIQNINDKFDNNGFLKTTINRYLRLAPPYIATLFITILCATIARHFYSELFLGNQETIPQIVSHLLLLQQILGFDSISLGVWYLAIDWQLYIFFAIVFYNMRNYKKMIIVLSGFMLLAFIYFSRKPAFENYFLYFIGTYGLGIIAYLWDEKNSVTVHQIAKYLFILFGLIILLDLLLHFSVKNFLAYLIACLLVWKGKMPYSESSKYWAKYLAWFSKRSYCAFLIHFSWILIFNTIFHLSNIQSGQLAIALMIMIVICTWISANYLYEWIECPTRKLQIR